MKTTSVRISFYFAIVLIFAGCSGNPRRGLSVAITGAPATVAPNQVVTLGAIVTDDPSNAGVTWAVNGSGTFTSTTSSLIYTAPATVPASPTVTVVATSITLPTKSATVTFTIAVPVISVSITNPISTIVAGAAATTLNATVTNDVGNAGVAWTLVTTGGSTACSPICGTISGASTTSVIYTPPATVAATLMASIVATSNADNTKSAIDAFTVTQPGAVAVTITNPITTATAGSDTNIVLNATVANDTGTDGVSWQLVTAGTTTACAPACGTVVTSTTTSLTYLPPATVPANPSTSIIATSIADTTKSATDTFTIQAQAASDLSYLSGPYAFAMSGFDANGDALTIAGSFVADGMGHINSGEIDVNDNFAITNALIVPGATYTLQSDLRGIITLAQPLSAFSNTATFSFTLDSASNNGNIIAADPLLPAVSGYLATQSPEVASALPSGDFIVRGSSDALALRYGLVGRFTIGGGGAINSGLVDSADAQNGVDEQDQTLSGTFSITDANGRGTVTLSQAGATSSNYAFYAVTPSKMFLIEISNSSETQVLAVARTQNLSSLTASSVNGTGVFGLVGGDLFEGFQYSSVTAGQLVISGGNSASFVCDINDAGGLGQCSTSITSVLPIPGTVTFDSTTGRGTITLPGGFDDGFVDSFAFYLEANGAGVLLDTTGNDDTSSPDSYPEAFEGDLIPQTLPPPNVAGQVQGVDLISENLIPVTVGSINISAAGLINGSIDATEAGVQQGSNLAVTGTVDPVDSTGRGVASITSVVVGTNAPAVAYSVNATQYFLIGEVSETASSLGVFTSQTLPSGGAAVIPGAKSSSPQRAFPRSDHASLPRVKATDVHHSKLPGK